MADAARPLNARDTGLPTVEVVPLCDRRSLLRSLCESGVCLLIAVLLFRTFAAEGYVIETGSMAPHLLGFHKRVKCPTCEFEFPFGTAYDTDGAANAAAETYPARNLAVCPNCGQAGIDLTDVPRNHGDQLLVFKPAYDHRQPRRWEVIVFRNPANPLEAYVKRVVGLPGERVQIIDGDVYADGTLCRKDWNQQRALRVLAHRHQAGNEDAPAHWRSLAATAPAVAWTAEDDRFQLQAAQTNDPNAWSWVEYTRWVPQRGTHETSVPLSEWPTGIEPSTIPPAGLKYDAVRQQLSCQGVLSDAVRDRLLSLAGDDEFQQAVRTLAEESHNAPVNDEYGYNPREGEQIPVPVRDLLVSLQLQVEDGEGEFAIELSDGAANYTWVCDIGRQQSRLFVGDQTDPVAEEPWPEVLRKSASDGRRWHVEMSLFDQQVLVAANGQPLLTPWTFTTPPTTAVSKQPARFGAQGLDVRVAQLEVYRDVYYTGTRSRNGVQSPYALGDDELFVLGDNSPLSHDSRRWADGAVPQSLLVGKPFVVHLPSKPGRLRIGNFEMLLRLPDLERVKFLRE